MYLFLPISHLTMMCVCHMFQSGAILNKMFQAHEAHIPYILQFMIDYNLYGMNLVNLENVKFRRDPENPGKIRMMKY